jgi:hypothetical protein
VSLACCVPPVAKSQQTSHADVFELVWLIIAFTVVAVAVDRWWPSWSKSEASRRSQQQQQQQRNKSRVGPIDDKKIL